MTIQRTPIALVAMCLQSGCATGLMNAQDREQVCQVSVVGKAGLPEYRAHPLANPSGPVAGAAAGAAAGSIAALYFLPLWFVTTSIGAAAGAAKGAACAAGATARPNDDVEFQAILQGAHTETLTLALQKTLNADASECNKERAGARGSATIDTVLEIDSVGIQGDCGFGKQRITASVRWRALNAADRRLLVERTTTCLQESVLEFEQWFADARQARSEIDLLLTRTGQRMAAELRSPRGLSLCLYVPVPTGETDAQ